METDYFQESDYEWMHEAIVEAKKAERWGRFRLARLLSRTERLSDRGYNLRETSLDPTAHAEMIAIREAAAGIWRHGVC